jgi:cation transport ATPase
MRYLSSLIRYLYCLKMKRSIVFLLLIISCMEGMAQNPGDSLALLYRRVYVYKNPDELSTRLKTSPYSYYDSHKFKYISTDEKYPHYYKILTPEGDTAYVKSKMVSANQSLTHNKIREEVDQGIRSKDPGKKVHESGIDLPKWATWAIFLGIIGLLILFWVKFKVLDNWFCRMDSSNTRRLRKPWFIKFAVIPGIVIGAMELISPKEYKWFRQEGFQIWGSYPSNWDWVMWAATVSVIFVAAGAVIQAFTRFRTKNAIFYALFSLVVIAVYFSVGMLVGALVAVLLFLGSGGGSSSSSGSAPSSEPEGTIRVVNGQRVIKTNRGTWDNF